MVSESRHWTVLGSADPVRPISCFYEAELRRRGWQARSSVVSARGATVVARRGPPGATISTIDTGSGTAITIATY